MPCFRKYPQELGLVFDGGVFPQQEFHFKLAADAHIAAIRAGIVLPATAQSKAHQRLGADVDVLPSAEPHPHEEVRQLEYACDVSQSIAAVHFTADQQARVTETIPFEEEVVHPGVSVPVRLTEALAVEAARRQFVGIAVFINEVHTREAGRDFPMLLQERHLAGEFVFFPHIIGMMDGHIFSRGRGDGFPQTDAGTTIFFMEEQANTRVSKGADNLLASVPGAVIEDQQFPVREVLIQYALDSFGYVFFMIVR